ncbi:MAG TPA: PKD domain-containing protein [Thermoplasmata archaeon]|nr:PKD domain-containing protein [Thermoplasmata archaeon]
MEQPVSFAPVPAGVTVDLISQATHSVYTTQTLSAYGLPSGQFSFNSGNTGGSLAPGWWGIQVPAQARLHLSGCNPCAILPASQTPVFQYFNSSALTTSLYPVTVGNVAVYPYNGTIFGNASAGTGPAVNASVQLLDPSYAGLVLANATTNRTGAFNFSAPSGTWVLKTTLPSSPNKFDYQQVVIAGNRVTVNPTISNILVSGYVNQLASGKHVPNGGNATVVDLTTMGVYTYSVPPLGFYAVGGYPQGFVGPGAENFEVSLSVVGYGTMSFPVSVTSSGASVASPYNVLAPAIAPPAVYNTTLDLRQGFTNLTVYTNATLGNDSTFPELPNASVGQLWGQLGLDFNHSLTFSSSSLPALYSWVQSEGPFFPAVQAGTSLNGVAFGANSSFGFTPSSTCSGPCGLLSSSGLAFGWMAHYNTTSALSSSLKNYTLGFSFRHPTHSQSINYTVKLPAGYVLSAGQAANAPAGSSLIPAGPGGTWTSFTLVSKPYSTASSTASLTIVKYGNITAIVNVSAQNFAFSHQNVLNQTRGNYTVVVGSGENVTFSAANSTFPAGTNGSLYQWNYGDSTPVSSSGQPVGYHTYSAPGKYDGTLTVTSSGGYVSATTFAVLAGGLSPSAVISANTTVQSANGVNYTIVNASTTIHFNATASTAPLGSFTTVDGVVSIASWHIVSHSFSLPANYTASSGVSKPKNTNLTYTFKGAGYYLNGTTLNGVSIAITGWQYNVSLEVWDGGGHHTNASMVVFVRDTQKPLPVVTILDSRGRTVTSSGVVEGANHTAQVQLSAANSTDPSNGSIVSYHWNLTNAGNSSFHVLLNQTATSPAYKIPARPSFWLAPQTKPYTVNLTVADRAGNTAYKVATITVAVNQTTRPVLTVGNLTAPGTMTDGTSYTIWVNVTDSLGKNSTAQNVSVRFYLLPPSGSGSPINIGGSPGSVQFFNYTSNTTVSSSPSFTGLATIKYNHTLRAEISWNPDRTGTFDLWVNATASNEFPGTYSNGANTAKVSVTLNPNPTTQYLQYAAIGGAVVVIIGVAWYLLRRRSRGGSAPKGKSSGTASKSGLERGKKDEDEEDEG